LRRRSKKLPIISESTERVQQAILERTGELYAPDAALEGLPLDSLELVELMQVLDIPLEAIDGLHTVGDVADYLRRRAVG
jgi:acyl carrier protein